MPLPRMTTRRWMIAVAVVGFAFWVHQLWEVRAARQRRADFHLTRSFYTFSRTVPGPNVPDARVRASIAAESSVRVLPDYHRRMYLKYEHAARYPFLPVPPDPPRPE